MCGSAAPQRAGPHNTSEAHSKSPPPPHQPTSQKSPVFTINSSHSESIERVMIKIPVLAMLLAAATACSAQRIEVTVPSTKPVTGHLILVFAKSEKPEPRMQLRETFDSAQGFGVD